MVANRDRLLRRDNMQLNDVVVTGTGGGRGTAAPSAAPAPATVFEQARKASAQREARSMAAADAAASEQNGGEVRRAGSRMFARDGDRWVDSRMKPELRVYKVKAYSRSYFALLEQIPELREAFTVGDHMLVAGKSVAVEVVDDAPELGESEIRTLVTGW